MLRPHNLQSNRCCALLAVRRRVYIICAIDDLGGLRVCSLDIFRIVSRFEHKLGMSIDENAHSGKHI